MMKVLAIYGSHRVHSNSEKLANIVLEGIQCNKIYLRDKVIQPIDDQRHTDGGFQYVIDDYDGIVIEMLKHDVLIFVTPIYWYGMSGRMKNFVDRWSQSLRDERFRFKEEMETKKAYVVVTGGDQPRIKGLPLIQQFKYIFDFVSIEFSGYIIGEGNKPGDILKDSRALLDAKSLNEKLQLFSRSKMI